MPYLDFTLPMSPSYFVLSCISFAMLALIADLKSSSTWDIRNMPIPHFLNSLHPLSIDVYPFLPPYFGSSLWTSSYMISSLISFVSEGLMSNMDCILLLTNPSSSSGFSLFITNTVISPGFMYFFMFISMFWSSTSTMLVLNPVASVGLMPNFGYRSSITFSLFGFINPVHWAVGSKTMTGTFLLRSSSAHTWADTDFPEPVPPAAMECIMSWFVSMYVFTLVSAMVPTSMDVGPA